MLKFYAAKCRAASAACKDTLSIVVNDSSLFAMDRETMTDDNKIQTSLYCSSVLQASSPSQLFLHSYIVAEPSHSRLLERLPLVDRGY